MILVDYNQLMITSLTGKWAKKQEFTEDFMRAAFLERIRFYNKKYRQAYGEMVICCDGPKYWRKDYFPFYKAGRREARDASPLDWNAIHNMMSKFREELDQYFPYKVIRAEGAEGDDVIAYMTKKYHATEKILIISGDGDMQQLQRYPNVTQFSPILKKFITVDNPIAMLAEKIIRGDGGDGIPNILSKDNIFLLEGERQKSILSSKIKQWIHMPAENFCTTEEMKHGWHRNQTLIDFEYIPQYILNNIAAEDAKTKEVRKDGLINYLITTGLTQFMPNLQDF